MNGLAMPKRATPGNGSRQRLLLFDIDGTLVRCGVQVRPIFTGAMVEVFGGHRPLDGYQFAGKTDPQIVLELAHGNGLSDEEILRRLPTMRTLYHARLDAGLDVEKMVLLPAVEPLLSRLEQRAQCAFGLLTGNWRDCAEVKLARFGLWDRFPFGAFGDDGVNRPDLVPAALERAQRLLGYAHAPEEVIIVGDSARDVACAHAHGIRAIAVATGFASEEALHQAGADWVYPDLAVAAANHPWLAGTDLAA
jgi:phosphoglycolate phosphatase-like HAD superfamily hydrolase